MRLMDVILLTHSLGEKLADESADQPETFRWTDNAGATVAAPIPNGIAAATTTPANFLMVTLTPSVRGIVYRRYQSETASNPN